MSQMRTYLRATAIMTVMLLLSLGSAFAAEISIGISIGAPPAPRVVTVLPPSPGPDFMWIEGYWYPVGHHYRWHDGYWTRPPYPMARWVVPHHDGHRYYAGYWVRDRGRIEREHRSDSYREHGKERQGKGRGRDRDRD